MYFHLSPIKFAIITLVCTTLYGGLVFAGFLKDSWYGSTPPFASIEYALKEMYLRGFYALEWAADRSSQIANASRALVTGERSYSRDGIKRNARGIPVLTYHRVVTNSSDTSNITERVFRDQMRTLKSAGWETITLNEYAAFMAGLITLPERSFLITFDDGAKDSFYPVDPLFQSLGYNGVIYIIASAPHTEGSVYYLTPQEILRMLDTGRWEIGSHSYDGHRPYPSGVGGSIDGVFFADLLWQPESVRLETAEEFEHRVQEDLRHAREALEKEYHVTIGTFAFPLGNETGVEGAANFPEGASITERIASDVYTIGFLQTNRHTYTYNFPGQGFISRRIHVEHDWDGARLLQEMEQGLEKNIPYDDDFSENKGWIVAWGSLDTGRNNLTLHADPGASSASAFLDGTKYWDDYVFDASLSWNDGSVFLLADVQNSKTYSSCVFSEGLVKIEATENGETRVVSQTRNPDIARGENVRIGVRVHGSVIECTWNYASVLEAYERPERGGIGIQVWNPALGTAELHVSNILVRPFENIATSSSPSS